MAHVQKRCRCGRVLEAGARSCPGSSDPSHGPTVLSWVARYVDDRRVERSRRFARRIDADRFLTSIESAKARGAYVDPAFGRERLEPFLWRWLERRRGALKPKTALGYESLIRSRIAPALGRLELGALRPSDVQAFVDGMGGLSASRIREAVVVLQKALDAAVRDGLVASNPARGVDLPRLVRREAPFLEPEIVEAIAAAAAEPHDLAIRIMGTLGLRFGELAALRRADVDLRRRRIRVDESLAEVRGELIFGPTKTHAVRSVPIPRSLVEPLHRHLGGHVDPDPGALLFAMPAGGPLRYSNFRRETWAPALERAKVGKVGIHALRHSAAALMISSGASPKEVQSILGHASAAFTLTVYGHLFDADLDAVADRVEAALARAHTGTRRAEAPSGAVLPFRKP
jgi:integrase